MSFSNIFLAISNLLVLPTIIHLRKVCRETRSVISLRGNCCTIKIGKNPQTKIHPELLLSVALSLCSTVQHLSDVKHGQLGLAPFSYYSHIFLWLDRTSCFLSMCYLFPRLMLLSPQQKKLCSSFFVLGLCAMGISELFNFKSIPIFTATHFVWHICAYRILHLLLCST